jgi:sulfite reductase alpha subunit-like flavoprotein
MAGSMKPWSEATEERQQQLSDEGETRMKKAAIVYHSRTGTTRRLAEEIGAFLATRDIEPTVVSTADCDVRMLGDVDYLFLGCWTSGLMVVLQHPDRPWIEFARTLPAIVAPRVGLFTTYKLASGSMFSQMRKHLASKIPAIGLELRSRTGRLSGADKRVLERFLTGA